MGNGMVRRFIPNPTEGVRVAVGAMRANKLRSALTILGVVIGVATVMAMASIVQGVRTQVFNTMDRAGPSVFYVIRYLSDTPVNPDRLPREVRIRPPVAPADAAVAVDLVAVEGEVDFFDAVAFGAGAERGFGARRAAAEQNAVGRLHGVGS